MLSSSFRWARSRPRLRDIPTSFLCLTSSLTADGAHKSSFLLTDRLDIRVDFQSSYHAGARSFYQMLPIPDILMPDTTDHYSHARSLPHQLDHDDTQHNPSPTLLHLLYSQQLFRPKCSSVFSGRLHRQAGTLPLVGIIRFQDADRPQCSWYVLL